MVNEAGHSLHPALADAVQALANPSLGAIDPGTAKALDLFCQAMAESCAGRSSDRTALRAGLEALDAIRRGPASHETSGWRAGVVPLLDGQHVVARGPGHELRVFLDADGVAWLGGLARDDAPDEEVTFQVRRAGGGWQLALLDEPERVVELGDEPLAVAWAAEPRAADLPTMRPESLLGGLLTSPPPGHPSPPSAAPAAGSSFALVFRSGPTPFADAPLAGRLVIGRESDCDLTLDDPGVSRHHAAVEPTPAGARVTDLGSSNGTYLNRRRLEAPAEVREGDEIVVGHSYLVLARGHRAVPPVPDVPAPPPAPASVPPAVPLRPPETSPRNCPRCGRGEPDAATRFCRGCGEPLGEIALTAPSTCAGCGRELHAGECFCTWCGRKVG